MISEYRSSEHRETVDVELSREVQNIQNERLASLYLESSIKDRGLSIEKLEECLGYHVRMLDESRPLLDEEFEELLQLSQSYLNHRLNFMQQKVDVKRTFNEFLNHLQAVTHYIRVFGSYGRWQTSNINGDCVWGDKTQFPERDSQRYVGFTQEVIEKGFYDHFELPSAKLGGALHSRAVDLPEKAEELQKLRREVGEAPSHERSPILEYRPRFAVMGRRPGPYGGTHWRVLSPNTYELFVPIAFPVVERLDISSSKFFDTNEKLYGYIYGDLVGSHPLVKRRDLIYAVYKHIVQLCESRGIPHKGALIIESSYWGWGGGAVIEYL